MSSAEPWVFSKASEALRMVTRWGWLVIFCSSEEKAMRDELEGKTCLFFEILVLHAIICTLKDPPCPILSRLTDRLLFFLIFSLFLLVIWHVDFKVCIANPDFDV